MEQQNNTLKYIIYRRKSSEADDRQTLSLGSQKKELAKFAAQLNLSIVKDIEEAHSAYKHGRPKFLNMVELIKVGKADAILVYHISRLARNMSDGGLIIDMLTAGVIKEVRTPTETYTKNSGQEFILALQFAMSKKSSDDTSEFVKRDIKTKLGKGELPNTCPVGYLNIDKEGKIAGKYFSLEKQNALALLNRPLKRVEKDPHLSPLVYKLFEMCATGQYTLEHLREVTLTWGLTGKRSRKKLGKATIYRILTNPFYYGAIRWRNKVIEPEEFPIKTKHEPTINRELFEKTQEALGLRNRPVGRMQFYSYSILTKCAVCGGSISGMVAKGHVYYRCVRCRGSAYIRQEELEKQIEAEITKMTIDDRFYNLAIEEINKANEKELSSRDVIRSQQQKALSNCQVRLDSLLRLKISSQNSNDELLTDDEFIAQKKETLLEMAAIKEKMNDLEQQSQNWFNLCVNYLDFSKNLLEKFKTATPQGKRMIFDFVCYNPVIRVKLLSNTYKSPNKFIVFYNEQKELITTTKNSQSKNKKEADASNCFILRNAVDGIITFFKEELKGYYVIPTL